MYKIYTRNSITSTDFEVAESETGVGPRMVSPSIRLEKNRGGSFEFSVYDDHPLYTNLKLVNDRILVENNGERIFCGRAIQESYDWYNRRHVVCEGALAFLSDVVVPYTSSFETASDYINYLIDYYNNSKNKDSRIENFDRFVVLSMPTEESVKSVADLTSNGDRYKTVFDLLSELLDFLDWFVTIDYFEAESDTYRLEFHDKAFYTHPVPVKFSVNLLDITRDNDMADFATVFYPLGRPKNTNANKVTIDDHRGTEISAGVISSPYTVILSDGTIKTVDIGGRSNYLDWYTGAFDYLEDGQKVYIRGGARNGHGAYVFVDNSERPLLYHIVNSDSVWAEVVEIPDGAAKLYVSDYRDILYPEGYGYRTGAWVWDETIGSTGRNFEDYEDGYTIHGENFMFIDSNGYVVADIDDPDYRVIDITGFDIIDTPKLIISTRNRNGYALYAFKDSYDHLLGIKMADDTPVLSYLKDEVVTIPEGTTHIYIGYYGSDNAYKVYTYINPGEDESLSHLGNDLMVKQVGNIRTVFGHIDGTTGRIVDYSKTAVIGAKTDSVVYAGIVVTPGNKYVYSGMNRDGHGMVRVRGNTESITTYLKTAGTELTNLQLFEFEVPEGTICDVGGILGDARTHLWEYVDDNDDKKDNYITIESENNGYPYLMDQELIALYGWIERVHTFNDIESPRVLMDKAQKYFADIKKKIDFTYKAKTVDPSLISTYRTYMPGDMVSVESKPHDTNVTMEVKSADLHLDNPQSNTYDLVYEKEKIE